MSRDPSELDRFLTVLHRRLLLVRLLEAGARGAVAGSLVGATLVPLLLWRDVPTLLPSACVIVLGIVAGMLWVLGHRPTLIDAAAEADRQLNLSDLLGTAVGVRTVSRESDRDAEAGPWRTTILAVADAACARHTPSQVILHRLNARAWGGVALAAAGVMTLSALTDQQPVARAAAGGAGKTFGGQGVVEYGSLTKGVTPPSSRAMARPQGTGPESSSDHTTVPRANTSTDDPAAGDSFANNSTRSGGTGDHGLGDGSARARTLPDSSPPPPAAARRGSAPFATQGDAGFGSGVASMSPAPTGASGGSAAGESPPASTTPPWHTDAWGADARRAHEALDAGRVPDARRHLVREYFDRP